MASWRDREALMAKYMQLVMVNARDGRDDEFNDWLDNHHIPEIVEAGGFGSAAAAT